MFNCIFVRACIYVDNATPNIMSVGDFEGIVCMHVCVYVCMYVSMYACMYVRIHVCMYV